MIFVPGVMILLMIVSSWSALGCDALRDFSYSRLEELCSRRGVPHRFGQILKRQGEALLALEFLLTFSTLGLATILFSWIGWPVGEDRTLQGVSQFVLNYALFAMLIFFAADLLPWTIARVAAEPFLCSFWPLVEALQTVLAPLLWIASLLDRYAHRVSGRLNTDSDDSSKIEEEIASVVEEGEREGVLDTGSTAMIRRVMQLQDDDVKAIMTPRTDMNCVSADLTLEEARLELIDSGHSRIPVIGDSTDDVLGILYAKDLLKALSPTRANHTVPVLRDIIREPVFVPITTAIPSLLELMKRQKIHMAIVNDEYGGVSGLVTMEDILEEIVGEIADEYDVDQLGDEIHELDEFAVEVSARVRLDELNRRFDFGLPEDEEFDTVGGFVFSQMGSMPSPGESFVWNEIRFTVLSADARVLKRLRIDRLSPAGSNSKNASHEA